MIDKINLELTSNEALVLFDLLSRFSDSEKDEVVFEDQSERRVLWDMQCMLEAQLLEPFKEDYRKKLEKARDAIRDAK